MKIEEIASSTYFLRQHSGWLTNEELEDVERVIKVRKEAFIKGANAVLKEIENILSLGYNTMATVDLIVEKVKELKGKSYESKRNA